MALEKCGNWGNHITARDLDDLFSGKPLQYLYDGLDHTIITKNADITVFKKELIIIWLKNTAFEHVICGEPGHRGNNNLGGLHYVGRYLDVQKNNWGGLNESCTLQDINFLYIVLV